MPVGAQGPWTAITFRQLDAVGISRRAIERRVARGELHRMHRGVYLVGHEALAPLARESAAILAVGKGAVISHGSAASVWGLEPPQTADAPVDVTVVARKLRSRGGLRIHRAGRLHAADRRFVDGVPVTAPARTLIDRAAILTEDELGREWADAQVKHRVTRAQVEAAIKRAGRRSGVGAMRALLGRELGHRFSRSEGERRMRRLIRDARLPRPDFNTKALGREVDVFWRSESLIVEVDGYKYHSNRQAFESDRARDAALVAGGYRVIRVTWRQLVDRPYEVAARIAQALQAIPRSRAAG